MASTVKYDVICNRRRMVIKKRFKYNKSWTGDLDDSSEFFISWDTRLSIYSAQTTWPRDLRCTLAAAARRRGSHGYTGLSRASEITRGEITFLMMTKCWSAVCTCLFNLQFQRQVTTFTRATRDVKLLYAPLESLELGGQDIAALSVSMHQLAHVIECWRKRNLPLPEVTWTSCTRKPFFAKLDESSELPFESSSILRQNTWFPRERHDTLGSLGPAQWFSKWTSARNVFSNPS